MDPLGDLPAYLPTTAAATSTAPALAPPTLTDSLV